MSDIGVAFYLADPNVWMRKSMNPYGLNYWEYVLIHSYDIMVVSHDASTIMERVSKVYIPEKDTKKKNTYYDPRRYLGANVGDFELPGGSVTVYYMSGYDYVK